MRLTNSPVCIATSPGHFDTLPGRLQGSVTIYGNSADDRNGKDLSAEGCITIEMYINVAAGDPVVFKGGKVSTGNIDFAIVYTQIIPEFLPTDAWAE
jgi:hypothetical protein